MKRDLLRQLASFHAVGAEGSIVAAARRLGKSPPAVHHDLARLEQRFGEKLFQKTGRHLRLTNASRQLHAEVSRSLDKLERDLDRFTRSGLDEPLLRIGAVAGFGRYRLAPLLFARAGASQVELLTGAHEEFVAALLADRIDAGITYRPVVATPIECESIATEELVLLGTAGTPRISRDMKELSTLSFVTYDEYEYVFAAWFQGALGRQPAYLKRSDHVTELEEALESVANGRGVTIAPADAWTAGPWSRRCSSIVADDASVSNLLLLLTLPGSGSATALFLRGLLGRASA